MAVQISASNPSHVEGVLGKIKGLQESIKGMSQDLSLLLDQLEAELKNAPQAPASPGAHGSKAQWAQYQQALGKYQSDVGAWKGRVHDLESRVNGKKNDMNNQTRELQSAQGGEMGTARALDDKEIRDQEQRQAELSRAAETTMRRVDDGMKEIPSNTVEDKTQEKARIAKASLKGPGAAPNRGIPS